MLKIEAVELYSVQLQTRLPFRYGIAEMRALPHVFVRVVARFPGGTFRGLAADHLPPRWFTKDPRQSVGEEIGFLLRVIQQAARENTGQEAPSVFDWWRDAYDRQIDWGREKGLPPLLTHFGVSLVERALIEAACQAAGEPFHSVLLRGGLGFDPARVHPELGRLDWRAAFAPAPLKQAYLRQTIGLGDPVFASECPAEERLNDGLPETIEEAIRGGGLRHFKIKLCGRLDEDLPRLERLAACFAQHCPGSFTYSLDGNEQYPSMQAFAGAWRAIARSPLLREPAGRLLCVEQPISRGAAFDFASGAIQDLPREPPVIIDESDGAIEDLPRALACGYAGTSHKNCKGVFRGLANRCLLQSRQVASPAQPLILTGEDLATIGPTSLPQDLAVQASLGIESVERNGHHYFRGLSALPQAVNEWVLGAHPGLYGRHPGGFAALQINRGRLDLGSLAQQPFGTRTGLPVEQFATPIPV